MLGSRQTRNLGVSGTSKMVMPNDGVADQNLHPLPSMTIDNGVAVDDRDNTYASPLAAFPNEQAVPLSYSYDAWTAHFVGSHWLSRTTLTDSTAIGTVVYNVSNNPKSALFPNSTPSLKFTQALIQAHGFYIPHIILKTKIVSRTGTKGRLLLAVVPETYEVDTLGSDAPSALKASGYYTVELSVDGDKTETIDMSAIPNMGFANSNLPDPISSFRRVVCVVAESFATTYSESAPSITISLDMQFGNSFQLSMPLKPLYAIAQSAASLSQPITPRNPLGYALGNNLLLRIGDKRTGQGKSLQPSIVRPPLVQNTNSAIDVLSTDDIIATLVRTSDPPTTDGVRVASFTSLFGRGYIPRNFPKSFLVAAEDKTLAFGAIVQKALANCGAKEIYAMTSLTGDSALPIDYVGNVITNPGIVNSEYTNDDSVPTGFIPFFII